RQGGIHLRHMVENKAGLPLDVRPKAAQLPQLGQEFHHVGQRRQAGYHRKSFGRPQAVYVCLPDAMAEEARQVLRLGVAEVAASTKELQKL
ncbi:MAG: hypothetical protein ACK559_36365, partial [bacterium]